MIKNLALGGMSNRMPLILGLLLGVISAALIVVYLGQGKGGGSGSGQVSGDGVPTVVASRDIAAGTKITRDMLTVRQLPADVVLQGAFQDPAGVVDKVTSVPIVSGEQVLASKVSDTGTDLSEFGGDLPLSVTIPSGKRAFAVEVSEVSAAGGLIKPGFYVDVIQSGVTVSATDSSQPVGTSCYLAQDVEVLAVSQEQVKATSESAGSAESIAGAGMAPTAVSLTLAVTPQEAGALAAAQQGVDGEDVGEQVWVSVRPFGEHGVSGDLTMCQ